MTQINRVARAMATIAPGEGAALTPMAEKLTGPALTGGRVEAFGADRYVVVFEADESAIVTLNGDSNTRLDLYVYDEDGYVVASDVSGGPVSVARWTPKWTGKFVIKVVNRSAVFNRYSLGTN